MTDRVPQTDLPLLADLGTELRRVERLQRERRARPVARLRNMLWRGLHPMPVAIALVLAATGVASAMGVVTAPWQPLFGSPDFAEPQPTVTAAKPPPDQLDALAVLRRAQTPPDRAAATPALRYFGESTAGVRTDYIRGVNIPGSHPAVLVPAALWRARLPKAGDVVKQNVVCLFVPDSTGDGGAKGCFTTAEVLDGTARLALRETFYSLVPDEVARVEADFGRGSVVAGNVDDNVVALPAPTGVAPLPTKVTWLASDGSTLKRSVLASAPLAPVPPAPPARSAPNTVNPPS